MPLPEDFESRTATLTTPKTQASTPSTAKGPSLPVHPPRQPRPPQPPHIDPGPPKAAERPVPTFPDTVPGGHWAWGMTPGGFGTTWVWDDPPAPPAPPAPPTPPGPPPPPPVDPTGPSSTTPAPQPTPIPIPRPTPAPTPQPPQPPPPPDPGRVTIAIDDHGTFTRPIYKGPFKLKYRITYRGGGSVKITVTCDGQTQTLQPDAGTSIEVEGNDISISATGSLGMNATVDVDLVR